MSLRKQILNELRSMLSELTGEEKGTLAAAGVLGAQAGGWAAPLASGAGAPIAGTALVPVGAVGAGAFLGVAAPASVIAIIAKLRQNLRQFTDSDPAAKQILDQIKSNPTKAYDIGGMIAQIVKTNPGANLADELGKDILMIMKAIANGNQKECLSFVTGWYGVTSRNDFNQIKQLGRLPNSYQECKQVGFTDCRDRAANGSTYGFGRGGILVPRRDLDKVDWFGERANAQTEMYTIWNKASTIKESSPTPPEPDKPKPPEPKPGLRGPGCKPGSSFIGLNGVTSGDGVTSVQRALAGTLVYGEMKRGSFTYNGQSDALGTFGVATESAVLDFQKDKGGKFAARIQNELGSSLGNPDGCVGPKTSCALVIAGSVQAVAGYDLPKCKAKFTKLKRGGKQFAAGETQAQKVTAESKNWADRTRESTTSSLFERLVKDVSNKKVI